MALQVQTPPPGAAFRAALARDLTRTVLQQAAPGSVMSVQATVVEGCLHFMALARSLGPAAVVAGSEEPGHGADALAAALARGLPPGVAAGPVHVHCKGVGAAAGPAAAQLLLLPAGAGSASGDVVGSHVPLVPQGVGVGDLRIGYVWPPCLACGPRGGNSQVEVVLEQVGQEGGLGAGAAQGGTGRCQGGLVDGCVGVRVVAVVASSAVADVEVALPLEDLRLR
jgi:hypothetical protein